LDHERRAFDRLRLSGGGSSGMRTGRHRLIAGRIDFCAVPAYLRSRPVRDLRRPASPV